MPPETRFLRLPQIIGQTSVSEAQALENRRRGRGPKRPRPAIAPLIPVRKSTWWAGVRSGKFPKPVKLGPRTTVWNADSIREFIEQAGALLRLQP